MGEREPRTFDEEEPAETTLPAPSFTTKLTEVAGILGGAKSDIINIVTKMQRQEEGAVFRNPVYNWEPASSAEPAVKEDIVPDFIMRPITFTQEWPPCAVDLFQPPQFPSDLRAYIVFSHMPLENIRGVLIIIKICHLTMQRTSSMLYKQDK